MESKENQLDVKRGKALFKAYVRAAGVASEDAKEDYTVTDAIVALLHYARSVGFDAPGLLRSAASHFKAETTVCEACGGVGDPDTHECKKAVANG